MSDSFIFVCKIEFLKDLIEVLAAIQNYILIKEKMLLRGALDYGKLYVHKEKNSIIGPAFISAFKCQENNAIYPRIIICNSIKDLVDYKDDSVKKYICHDKEEIIDYIDFSLDCDVLEKEVFIFLEKKYTDNKNNLNIRQKYGWMKNYLEAKKKEAKNE